MSNENIYEPMLDMFIFETNQQIEQLEQIVLEAEQLDEYSGETINKIFRIMHTIKGSSAMMNFNKISTLAHSIEDLFFYIREKKPQNVDWSTLSDLVFDVIDYFKQGIDNIKNGNYDEEDSSELIDNNNKFLNLMKNPNGNSVSDSNTKDSNSKTYEALIFFEENCEMENIRAYSLVNNLKSQVQQLEYFPKDILENEDCINIIRDKGFKLIIKTDITYDKLNKILHNALFVKEVELKEKDNKKEKKIVEEKKDKSETKTKNANKGSKTNKNTHVKSKSTLISVNVDKLDLLMNLVGELIISESMVTHNIDNKASHQLKKIINELQDAVMSLRLVPLTGTFNKMTRIVRDMSKKLNKKVKLELIGQDTEVDKNIIEHISDPLMHLIRNAVDHGIENNEDRIAKGKDEVGKVTLEAVYSGSDVLIFVKDDGKGLDKEKIIAKAKKNNFLKTDESKLSDQEIYSMIFLPGFSTKEGVTEFSGRGVGMDVVVKNIEVIGGVVSVDSKINKGTTIQIKIPLTLSIIDGMCLKVGNYIYTIPTLSITESIKPKDEDIIYDADGNEMLMLRNTCYPIIRLHKIHDISTKVQSLKDGILVVLENGRDSVCVFVDDIIGEQQVVVKEMPQYIKNFNKLQELSGCTLLGDGTISFILDIYGLAKYIK